jgi:hypothetical protein
MVRAVSSRAGCQVSRWGVAGLALLTLSSTAGCRSGCRWERERGEGEKVGEFGTVTLGEVRVGREVTALYIAYGIDSAVLGFSSSTEAGPIRYFPIFASTYRGIPPVALDVYASKSEEEMWIRSSWPDNEILAYHRIGAETAITQWGEMKPIKMAMPDHLSGGALPFPGLVMGSVVKKATFNHQ